MGTGGKRRRAGALEIVEAGLIIIGISAAVGGVALILAGIYYLLSFLSGMALIVALFH